MVPFLPCPPCRFGFAKIIESTCTAFSGIYTCPRMMQEIYFFTDVLMAILLCVQSLKTVSSLSNKRFVPNFQTKDLMK